MNNGYERFFKQAQQARGLVDSKEPKFRLKPKKEAKPETPEERLRKEIAKRIRAKKRQALERKKLPVYPVVVSAIAFVLCGLAYHYSDELVWLERIEIGFLGSARAAGETASNEPLKNVAQPAKSSQDGREQAANSAGPNGGTVAKPSEQTKQWTQEEINYFTKLNERKRELDQREAELAKLEEELQRRKEELDEKLKQLENMRAEISKALASRVAEDQARVMKLVEVYSGMKPAQAARVIETLNEDLAVEVLEKMKKKNAAEILDMMDAKKARRLSELLAGYQKTASSEAEVRVPANAEEGN